MRIWDIITGKARRERKEAEARRQRQEQAKRNEDSIRRREDAFRTANAREIERSRRYDGRAPGTPYRRGEVGEIISPAPDITSPLNPANPFYGTGYGVSGHNSTPASDCSPSSSSSGGYGGDSGGSCGGGDGGGGGGGGD